MSPALRMGLNLANPQVMLVQNVSLVCAVAVTDSVTRAYSGRPTVTPLREAALRPDFNPKVARKS